MTNDESQTLHQESLLEFDQIQAAVRDERRQCLKDRRFYLIAGAQWEDRLGEQFENKPKLEFNKIHLAIIRIISEYRNNRITVDFKPSDGKKNDRIADILDGLYRATEKDSDANEAYDNAFEEAVGGGIGAWRLTTKYEDEYDEDNDYQKISIEPIQDADNCVFFDLGSKKQNKSDAKSCYVLTSMTEQAYIEEYNDDPASWPHDINQYEFDWNRVNTIYVAEKYKIEEVSETVFDYEDIGGEVTRYRTTDFENDPDLKAKIEAQGSKQIRKKRVKTRKVHKLIMSGGGILEDCGYIAGTEIPIVMTFGKRAFVDNIERAIGHVRLCKDPQRLKNMQLSKLAEISALSTVEKPIFLAEQMAGHTQMWKDDNIKNYPYLLLKKLTDKDGNVMPTGPVGYTKPPQIPPALAALSEISDRDIKEMLGNQEAGETIASNISGAAIGKVQKQLGMQTYIYMSNMAKAIQRSGQIWLSMAKDIFIESDRKMKMVDQGNEVSSVDLGKATMEEGKVVFDGDLSKAKHDVTVTVGPSSESRREATVNAIIGLMQMTQDPETQAVLSAMALMNMEGEGIEGVRAYSRDKLIKMGVIEPNKEEAAKLAEEQKNAPPDPNTTYLLAESEKALADAKKSEVEALAKLADVELTKAKIMETLAGIDSQEEENLYRMLTELKNLAAPMGENVGV